MSGAFKNGFSRSESLFEISFDVFDGYSGVVHQNTHGKSQSAQRHDIDRLSKKAEDDHRSEDRQWNGNGDNQCAAPASEEKQDHQRSEAGGNHCLSNYTADGRFHKDRLIGQWLHL